MIGPIEKKTLSRVSFLIALTVALYWPVLRWLGRAWIENDYYNHGFFLPVISLVLIWLARDKIRQAPLQGQATGLPVLILAGILYIIGFLYYTPVVLAFSLLFFLAALCLQLLGTAGTRYLLFPIFLPVLAIPMPSFEEFGIRLQEWSAAGADGLADLLGMNVASSGNTITINAQEYEVAPACSGLNRIMPLFSLTAILAYILSGRLWKKALLLALVIPVALFSNIIRITITLAAGSRYGADTALGFFHDFSSVVLFVVAVGVIILVAFILKMLHLNKEIGP